MSTDNTPVSQAETRRYPNYLVVKALSTTDLQEQVNALMDLGYRPSGGVCATHTSSYVQAMLRADA